jgi:ferritin
MNKLSVIRQNFHDEVEANINRQVNVELKASYIYQSMVILFFFELIKKLKNTILFHPSKMTTI